MTIDKDVALIAASFGIDPALIQAVVNAEGGGNHILTAVRCSRPETKTRADAIRITCRSAVHALSDYVKQEDGPGFVAFWAARWAPLGAQNDPHNLNQHWSTNVVRGWIG